MIALVIPSNRPERIADWFARWKGITKAATVYLVEDGPSRTFKTPRGVRHFAWSDIDADLGESAWIIPRRTDCVRSYGYLKAWQDGATEIITLDDDCYPFDLSPAEFIASHVVRLNWQATEEAWASTINGATPRGVPYFNRSRRQPCGISHGLWQNVADLDAPTQLVAHRLPVNVTLPNQVIDRGAYFAMCGMNLAWRRELTPAMWFGLQGGDYPFDRAGDIWAGVAAKRICDHLGYGVWSGEPHVLHFRASNVFANLKKEASAIEANETFWQAVDAVRLTGSTVADCYREIAEHLPILGDYWDDVRRGMEVWAGLFD